MEGTPADTEAHVYTSQGDPEQVDLADQFGFLVASDNTDGTVPNSVLTDDANRPRIVSSDLTSRSGTTDHTELDAFTAGRVQYSGTYAGVSGHYVCSTGCTVTVNGDGEIVALTGWTFRATDPDKAKVAMPDANYLYFGWWKQTSTANGTKGDISMAGAFSGMQGTGNTVTAITLDEETRAGSATYTLGMP